MLDGRLTRLAQAETSIVQSKIQTKGGGGEWLSEWGYPKKIKREIILSQKLLSYDAPLGIKGCKRGLIFFSCIYKIFSYWARL
jgi:hypothetical protein